MKYKIKEIKKIEKIVDTVYVNDLSVLDDNSYIVNDVCVHNCGCLTTQQTGIGYPMASLIKETYDLSCTMHNCAKIVADGGFKKYSDVIKALALGADYVMLGSIFNKALESAGETFRMKNDGYTYAGVRPEDMPEYRVKVDQFSTESLAEFNNMPYGTYYVKKFRGMSTKDVQKSLGNEILKTSEGIVKYQKVEYTLAGWVENFEHYLKSAMSYTDAHFLGDFIGEVQTIDISTNSFNRYNK
jgi:GMP reductase